MHIECRGGYWRKVLRVNLDTRKHVVEEIPEEFLRSYLGGRGLGIKLLFNEEKYGLDPFSPENPLIFITGPITGTSFPTASRTVLVTISPLTGLYLYSVAGGKFGRELKKAGYDALIIEGAASNLSVLVIRDDDVRIEEAESMRGGEVTPAVQIIKDKYGDKLTTISIGPAGENLVKYASITSSDNRSFGRGGAGAVMGSKNLKAIVVSGSYSIKPIDEESFSGSLRKFVAKLKETPGPRKDFPRYGTADGPEILSYLGILPTRNWSKGTFEQAWKISMPYLREEGGFVQKDVGCFSCLIRCSKEMHVKEGEFAGAWNEGPEYETLYALGSNLEIDSPEFIIAANQRCDELGLDTISTGGTIGFAMECFEKGILTSKDTNGLELRFGNARAALEVIEAIAQRRGIGDLLAEGTRLAANQLGKNSNHFSIHCKGMELGGYDPRGAIGQALVYAAGNRGGCHHSLGLAARKEVNDRTAFESKQKGRLVRDLARERILADSLPCCTFAMNAKRDLRPFSQLLEGLTGWEWDIDDLLVLGDRVNSLERAFNCMRGLTSKDDILPERLFQDPLPDGLAKGRVVSRAELSAMLQEYYSILGWEIDTGIPELSKL